KLGPLEVLGVAQSAKQRAAALLIGELFGMLKRQEEELSFILGQVAVEAAGQRAIGYGEGQRVGGIAARVTPKHVARKLIEDDDQRQRAVACGFPIGKLACRRCFVGAEKAPTDFGVERIVLGEPLVLACGAPESEHFARRSDHSRTSPLSMRR